MSTRNLLRCGVVAGPLFLIVAFTLALTRLGFDIAKHPFSLLSLGQGGWMQITNFAVSGLLFVACAIGLRRSMRPGAGATWGPLFIGIFGAAMIAGGVFVSDAGAGFPPGAPEGAPTTVSWHGALHGLAFAMGMIGLIAAVVVFARRFAAENDRGWAWGSVAAGIGVVVLGGAGTAAADWRLTAAGIVVGWLWASAVPARFLTPDRAASAAEEPATGRV